MSLFNKHLDASEAPERSGYYWWYQFLKEVPGYRKGHRLWDEFGDVHSMPFEDWFHSEQIMDLFDDGSTGGVYRVMTPEGFDRAINQRGRIVLALDPSLSRSLLMRQVGYALSDADIDDGRHRAVGRPKHDVERGNARYTFWQRPDVVSLRTTYNCWVYFKENPHATLYEIGLAQKLVAKKHKVLKSDPPKVALYKKSIVNATISRYLKRARKLIENAGIGIFPCYD